jgi:iron complex transport system substrate-binding protein
MSATGKSVIDQLIAIRMDAAKQMLLDREQPIKNVASAVGYPDVRYFITLFGKQTGTTPARWRATGGTRFLKRK